MHCGHHPRPLLEDRAPGPPSQVLPPMDAEGLAVPAVVERRRGEVVAGCWHRQNCQRKMHADGLLANQRNA